MASYYELLKHPNWQRRRLEIFERAGFECEQCGDNNKTLHVHHCYYERGKRPWEYPDQHLKCLCEDCHKSAEDRKLAASKILIETGCEDEVCGYTLGALASDDKNILISVDSHEMAQGMADYWGLDVEQVLIPELIRRDGKICGRTLLDLMCFHFGTKNFRGGLPSRNQSAFARESSSKILYLKRNAH